MSKKIGEALKGATSITLEKRRGKFPRVTVKTSRGNVDLGKYFRKFGIDVDALVAATMSLREKRKLKEASLSQYLADLMKRLEDFFGAKHLFSPDEKPNTPTIWMVSRPKRSKPAKVPKASKKTVH